MTAILECTECGFQAVFEQEDGLNQCPKCDDVHVDVTYGVPSYVSFRRPKSEIVYDDGFMGTCDPSD